VTTDGPLRRLTVLYDEDCGFCRWCRQWLEGQRQVVRLRFLAAGSPEAKNLIARAPANIEPGSDLVVIGDDGRVWTDTGGYLMCLWATRRWRRAAKRLAAPGMLPLTQRLFRSIDSRRAFLSKLAHAPIVDGQCFECAPVGPEMDN